jgi:LPS-assembly lipoprotein
MSLRKTGNRANPNRRFIVLAPLALAACGFQPAFAPGQAGAALHNRVLVDAPSDKNSYLLTREIEERLGRGENATFGLALTITTSKSQLAVDREGNTGRFHLLGTLNYSLRDLNSGQIVGSNVLENFVGYSATGTTVVTLAGERDARERLMNIFADQLVARLLTLDLPA